MPDSLRAKIIRLAYTHINFRAELLPLLNSADPSNLKPIIAKPAAKVGKLMSRQEVILRNYLQQAGSRAVNNYDDLPQVVKNALVKVKDQETLWSDVNRWFEDNRPASQSRWAAWENLPPGWTQESVQSMWDTMTEGVKHKITKCMETMDGKVDDPGAFCGSLAAQVGYKRAARKVGDATLLRKAIIRVAHENPDLRTTLLPCILRRA